MSEPDKLTIRTETTETWTFRRRTTRSFEVMPPADRTRLDRIQEIKKELAEEYENDPNSDIDGDNS